MPSPINNDTQISNTSLINNATQINHNSGRRSLQGDVAQNEDLTLDYSVDELLAMASHDKFPPKKAFKIEGKIKAFTPILWFDSSASNNRVFQYTDLIFEKKNFAILPSQKKEKKIFFFNWHIFFLKICYLMR